MNLMHCVYNSMNINLDIFFYLFIHSSVCTSGLLAKRSGSSLSQWTLTVDLHVDTFGSCCFLFMLAVTEFFLSVKLQYGHAGWKMSLEPRSAAW